MMKDIVLAADQIVQTEEEKIWVVETLLKRQIAIMKQEPVTAITHDILLGLIGEDDTFIDVSRFDEMTRLFSDMKVANIHIGHICVAKPDSPGGDGTGDDTPDAGPHAFMLSDALTWFAHELSEYDEQEKIAQCQSLGMLLVFMVRKSFMADFEGGVSLANHFLDIVKYFPGLDAERGIRPPSSAASDLSSAEVCRNIFRYLCGKGSLPDHEIAVVLIQGDFVINGIEGAIAFFEDAEEDGNVRVSCHFIPYLPEQAPPKGIIRLSDLIVTVTIRQPAPGQPTPVGQANLMGLLYHVANSNIKTSAPITSEELGQWIIDYGQIIHSDIKQRH